MKRQDDKMIDATKENAKRAMFGYTPTELAQVQKRELLRGILIGMLIGGGLVAVVLGQVMMLHGTQGQ